MDNSQEIKKLTAWQKFEAVLLAAQAQQVSRAELKRRATHIQVGSIQPMNGLVGTDDAGNRVKIKVPACIGGPKGKGKPVVVAHYKFVGWDYGKKYTVQKLQELAKERRNAA